MVLNDTDGDAAVMTVVAWCVLCICLCSASIFFLETEMGSAAARGFHSDGTAVRMCDQEN